MSQLRIIVELAFKEMVTMFEFLNYIKNQKHLPEPIGVQFRVTALFHNAHVCLHYPQKTQCLEISQNVGTEEQVGEMIEE